MDDDRTAHAQPLAERRRSSAVRLVTTGFALPVLSIVVAASAGNVTGAFGYAPLAVLSLVVLIVVVLTGRAFAPALVTGVLLLLLSLLSASGDLAHPESFADFVPALLRAVGFAVATAGAVIGLRSRRRGTLHRTTPRQQRAALIGAGCIVLAGLGSYVLTQTSRTTVRNAGGATIVQTSGDEFDPDVLHLEAGRVRVLVRNTDSYAHSFTVDDLAIDEYIPPRSDKLLTLDIDVPAKAGSGASRRFVLSCAVTGHESMLGSVVVDD